MEKHVFGQLIIHSKSNFGQGAEPTKQLQYGCEFESPVQQGIFLPESHW